MRCGAGEVKRGKIRAKDTEITEWFEVTNTIAILALGGSLIVTAESGD